MIYKSYIDSSPAPSIGSTYCPEYYTLRLLQFKTSSVILYGKEHFFDVNNILPKHFNRLSFI